MPRVRLSWKILGATGIIAAFAAVLGALALSAVVWTEYGWYASLDRQSVLTTRIVSQLSVWIVCTAVAFSVLYATARAAGRLVQKGPRFDRIAKLSTLAVAAAASISIAQHWMVFRLALTQSPFGITDPQFGMDVGFFVFTLPALEILSTWVNGLIVLSMTLALGILAIPNRDDLTGKLASVGWEIKALAFRLLGFLMLSVAFNFWISIWRLIYTSRATLVGASYADVHAQLPADWTMVVLSVALAILLFATAKSRTWKLAAAASMAWVAAGIVLVSAWPAVVQRYLVAPNEAALEAPYIRRNIDMTRQAFELTSVNDREYAALPTVAAKSTETAISALRTARVWTPTSVGEAYAQLQSIRPYYRLSPIETDRYVVSGTQEQVLVSAREIDTSGLPKKARTWVNQHLVYTHGNGMVISSASRTSPQGFPEFLVGDVPPRMASGVASDSPTLATTQPRIYYGSTATDYAIVNTGIDEFDYPAGTTNATYRHDAVDGVDVGGLIGRVIWAVRLQSMELLFSDYIEPDSQVLMYREVVTRAKKIAPWLMYDERPYPALVDGHIVWILDAYTASDHFPYAQTLSDGTNYLRDSVKVTVDAYTGEVRFFANGQDPIRDAWAGIFPGVIEPQSKVPSSLAAHFRYPEKFFSAQSEVYRTYHMTDPMVFYNKEDQWQIVGEKGDNPLEPTYLLLDLPGSKHGAGLYLVQPYAPPKRDNMIGIIATDSEPAAYGEQTVFLMPKERVVLGPQQVIARIEQDPTISPQLSLWDQRGSKVVFGDMSVLPVEGSIAYIQPVFLQAENTAFTELAAVIVVSGDRISMDASLAGALDKAFGSAAARGLTDATGVAAGARVDALLEAALKAKTAEDWDAYGVTLMDLRAALDSLDPEPTGTTAP